VALSHQHQKELRFDASGCYIEVDLDDIELTNLLAVRGLGMGLSELSVVAVRRGCRARCSTLLGRTMPWCQRRVFWMYRGCARAIRTRRTVGRGPEAKAGRPLS